MSNASPGMPADREEIPASRRRGGLAATRGGGQLNERTFFCRSCQMVERGLWVPSGWYLLERAPGGSGRHLRLGLYCSLACLMEAAGELAQGAAEHADRLGLDSEDAHNRRRTRILETAQTLIHGGMSIRQAAESLEVPTVALRTWLRAAGISVGATGTPPGADRPQPGPPARTPPAGPPSPPVNPVNPVNPVSRVNELAQQGTLTDLRWDTEQTGPPHRPTFTVTATARPAGAATAITASGNGTTKTEAKAQAAAALLTALPT
jgi:Double-stranded RNA binding motif